jgi:hypothetical protein
MKTVLCDNAPIAQGNKHGCGPFGSWTLLCNNALLHKGANMGVALLSHRQYYVIMLHGLLHNGTNMGVALLTHRQYYAIMLHGLLHNWQGNKHGFGPFGSWALLYNNALHVYGLLHKGTVSRGELSLLTLVNHSRIWWAHYKSFNLSILWNLRPGNPTAFSAGRRNSILWQIGQFGLNNSQLSLRYIVYNQYQV